MIEVMFLQMKQINTNKTIITQKGTLQRFDDRFLILPIKPAENKYTSTNECVDYKSIKIFYTASKMEWNEAKTTSGLQILSIFYGALKLLRVMFLTPIPSSVRKLNLKLREERAPPPLSYFLE